MGDESLECYKIEADPDFGQLLNWIKLFVGDLKSYIWITKTYPKLITRIMINTPWMKEAATLKEVRQTMP